MTVLHAIAVELEAQYARDGFLLAVSLWQPWASAVAYGPKRVENRPFTPRKLKPGDLLTRRLPRGWRRIPWD